MDKDAGGKYHFTLVASNVQVIATSEAYERDPLLRCLWYSFPPGPRPAPLGSHRERLLRAVDLCGG